MSGDTELFKYGPKLNGIRRVDLLPTAIQFTTPARKKVLVDLLLGIIQP